MGTYDTQIANFDKMKAQGQLLTAKQQALYDNALAKLGANASYIAANPNVIMPGTGITVADFQNNINAGVSNFSAGTAGLGYTPDPVVVTGETEEQKAARLAAEEEARRKAALGTGTTITPTPTAYNPLADIEALTNLQRQKSAADLAAKRDSSLASLSEQRSGITPAYQGQRTTQDTSSKIASKNFAEYLAQRGQNNPVGESGTMNQFKTASDIANMQSLSNLYGQEQSALDKNSRDVSGVQTGYNSDVASANMGIDAQALQIKIDALQSAQNKADTQAQADKVFNYNVSQDKLSTDTAAKTKTENDFVNTLGAYSGDYQAEINTIANDGDITNDWKLPYLKAARQEKVNAQNAELIVAQTKAIADQKADTKATYDAAYDRWKLSGIVGSDADAKVLGIPKGTKTEAYAQAVMSNTVAQQNANNGTTNSTTSPTLKADFADDYAKLKGMGVKDAIAAMTSQWAAILQKYGVTTAKSLWNTVLDDAIIAGQAVKK